MVEWHSHLNARIFTKEDKKGLEALDSFLSEPSANSRAYHGLNYQGKDGILLGRVLLGAWSGSKLEFCPEERYTHTHVLGNSGSGKTTLFEQMIIQDIDAGHGVCLLEPSGTLFSRILKHCMWRFENGDTGIFRKLHVFDPNMEREYVTGFNPLPPVTDKRFIPSMADKFAETILRAKGLDNFTESPRLASWLRTIGEILLTLGRPLTDALPLMSMVVSHPYRAEILNEIRPLKPHLAHQYDAMLQDGRRASVELSTQLESVRNVLQGFLSKEYIREVISAPHSIDTEKIMREGHILLFHTSVGGTSISDSDAHLLACFLMSSVYQAAMGRLNDRGRMLESSDLHPFFVYVDEFARYLSREVIRGLAELRRYRVGYVLAHQYVDQLRHKGNEDVLNAVVSATQNKIVMAGLGDKDAEFMAKDIFATEIQLKVEKHRIETKSQWSKPAEVRILKNTSVSKGTSHSSSSGRTLTAGETHTREELAPGVDENKPLRIMPYRDESDFLRLPPIGDNESLEAFDKRSYQSRQLAKRDYEHWLHDQAAQESRFAAQQYERENKTSHSISKSEARTETTGKSWSESQSEGVSQTLYEEKYEVTQTSSIQYYSKEELLFQYTKRLRMLTIGQAIFKSADKQPLFIQVQKPESHNYDAEEMRVVWQLLHKYHPSVYRADLNDDQYTRTLSQHKDFLQACSYQTPEQPPHSPSGPLCDQPDEMQESEDF
ncbi:MAG: type IV secretory system conjugative DNA transfer family protein [Bacteriovoracia bacterium]